jgi:hypothetical protein
MGAEVYTGLLRIVSGFYHRGFMICDPSSQ